MHSSYPGACPYSSLPGLVTPPFPWPFPQKCRKGSLLWLAWRKPHILLLSLSPAHTFPNSPCTKTTSITQLEKVLSPRTWTATSHQVTIGVCESLPGQDSWNLNHKQTAKHPRSFSYERAILKLPSSTDFAYRRPAWTQGQQIQGKGSNFLHFHTLYEFTSESISHSFVYWAPSTAPESFWTQLSPQQ